MLVPGQGPREEVLFHSALRKAFSHERRAASAHFTNENKPAHSRKEKFQAGKGFPDLHFLTALEKDLVQMADENQDKSCAHVEFEMVEA
eukprot:g37516.t1